MCKPVRSTRRLRCAAFMKHVPRLAAAAAVLLCSSVSAVETNMAPGGYTGLGITPSARLLAWGQFALAYDRQLPGASDPSGHNFIAGFGLLPNLEVSGRIAANSPLQRNCFIEVCNGIRDLSASAKLGIGLDSADRFRMALGAADIGGAATNFRTYYGVLTYSEPTVEISAGLAQRRKGTGSQSPLHGPFASAAWQPLSWLRGHVEYSDRNAWAGVRLFAPKDWLPEGWSAHIGTNVRLTDSNLTSRSWLSAGLSIPLYKVPSSAAPKAPLPELSGAQQPLPAYEARTPAPGPSPQAGAEMSQRNGPVIDDALQELARALQDKGLEDVWIGRMSDGSIAVRANNATYNWNTVDALGAALGATARTLGHTRTAYRLLLTQRQVPLVAITGQTDCLREWIEQSTSACPAGELSTPGTTSQDALQAGATWVVRGLQPSWKTLRVQLTPVLRTNVATEVGTLDYSAGVNVGFLQPLWAGASAEWRVQGELSHSDDFDPDRILGRRRVRGGTERLAFTQTMRLPLERWLEGDDVAVRRRGLAAVTAQATVGRLAGHFDGVHGSVRWEPGEGRHRLTAQAGYLHNSKFGLIASEPRNAVPLLLSYRYDVASTRTYLEATGGEFMNNDRGLQLGLRQWFGDISVQVYLRRTRFSSTGSRSTAGLELSIPIGPRREMQPSVLQVTGTPRFSHAIETTVGARVNAVVVGHGVLPPAPSLEAVHNSDRSSLLYFEDNVRRLRDAAR